MQPGPGQKNCLFYIWVGPAEKWRTARNAHYNLFISCGKSGSHSYPHDFYFTAEIPKRNCN